MIAAKKLCFSCLTPGHSSKQCKRKLKCGIDGCNFFHNRLLHGAQPVQAAYRQADQHRSESQVHVINATSLRYVPVEVSGPGGSEVI